MTILLDIYASKGQDRSFKFTANILRVFEILLNHPEMASEDVVKYLKVGKEELMEIYSHIAKRSILRQSLISRSTYSNYTIPFSEMLHDAVRLERIIEGEIVYPEIVEMHLGPFCNSNCIMCFSHNNAYIQDEVNKEHANLRKQVASLEEQKKEAFVEAQKEIDEKIRLIVEQKSQLTLEKETLTIEEINALL